MNNSSYINSSYENTSYEIPIFISTICFILMILTYITIYKIYHNDNDQKYEYEPLFQNYGSIEEL